MRKGRRNEEETPFVFWTLKLLEGGPLRYKHLLNGVAMKLNAPPEDTGPAFAADYLKGKGFVGVVDGLMSITEQGRVHLQGLEAKGMGKA